MAGGQACASAKAADQFARVDVERRGELQDVVERQVALAALDLADEGPVQVALVGECFLAETELLAAGSHASTELACCWREWWLGRWARHAPNPTRPKSLHPETLRPNCLRPMFKVRPGRRVRGSGREAETMAGGGDFTYDQLRESGVRAWWQQVLERLRATR
jgi:hypothetical protein